MNWIAVRMLMGSPGKFQQVILLGLVDATLTGMPSEILAGQVESFA